SNHATIAGATAATVVLLSRRLALLAVPLALLAAFSRTFVGVHYPHDVLAGLLLGAVVAVTATLLLAPTTARWAAGWTALQPRPLSRPAPSRRRCQGSGTARTGSAPTSGPGRRRAGPGWSRQR